MARHVQLFSFDANFTTLLFEILKGLRATCMWCPSCHVHIGNVHPQTLPRCTLCKPSALLDICVAAPAFLAVDFRTSKRQPLNSKVQCPKQWPRVDSRPSTQPWLHSCHPKSHPRRFPSHSDQRPHCYRLVQAFHHDFLSNLHFYLPACKNGTWSPGIMLSHCCRRTHCWCKLIPQFSHRRIWCGLPSSRIHQQHACFAACRCAARCCRVGRIACPPSCSS